MREGIGQESTMPRQIWRSVFTCRIHPSPRIYSISELQACCHSSSWGRYDRSHISFHQGLHNIGGRPRYGSLPRSLDIGGMACDTL